MKKVFLIIVACSVGLGSFAQAKKGATTTPSKPAATQQDLKPPVNPPADTTKKSAAVKPPVTTPAKPFDRPVDGYYKKNNITNAHVTPLAVLREADVVYSRRIWREIDLREKMNQYLGSPKARLIDVLMDAVSSGELTAYDPTPTKDDPDGDAFGTPLTPEKAKLKMADSSAVTQFDKNGDKVGSKMVAGEFNPDSVYKFRLKEDVIFDKQRSVEEIRIIGIAPLVKPKVSGASVNSDFQPAFGYISPQRARYWLPKKWLTAGTTRQA